MFGIFQSGLHDCNCITTIHSGGTVSASEIHCTPLVLSSRKILDNAEAEMASAAGLGWGGMGKGWMTGEALVGWVNNFIIPDVKYIRQRTGNHHAQLILDGHSSRNNAEVMNLLREAIIHVFSFHLTLLVAYNPWTIGYFLLLTMLYGRHLALNNGQIRYHMFRKPGDPLTPC